MQFSALAHTVCLHRVRLPFRSGCSGSCGVTSILPADMEPIVVLTENDSRIDRNSGGTKRDKQSVIEQCAPLRAMLGWFCGSLLVRQAELAARQPAASRHELYSVDVTSPVAEEGIFVQVPSRPFISECMRSATSDTVMDIVLYNSLGSRWWRDGEKTSSSAGGGSTDCNDVPVGDYDEGYVYGFAQFVDVGHAMEGLLLCAFSVSPLFNMLRTVILGTLPHVIRAVRDVRADSKSMWQKEDVGVISALCTEVMLPLADLVDARSTICKTPVNGHFYLPFPHTKDSILRPDDLRCPFIDVPLSTFFLSFSYNALRVIHSLLLQEKRVVFIGATPQHASACVVSVQAMLIPLIWTLPIVPYLPPEASDIIETLGTAGFIVGSTADIVPRLMLHSSFSSGQFGILAGKGREEKDRCRIWFADGRTGVIGVSPCGTDSYPFTMLDLVPPSEKLKETMKRVVTKEGRHLFRVTLASMVAYALGSSLSLPSTLIPSPHKAIIEEAHGVFLEYSVHRLVGNYRRGLLSINSVNGYTYDSSGLVSRLRGSAAYVLDYTRFLPSNLENNTALAHCIARTRMYRHWEDAVLSLETIGLLRSLLGEFVRSRARSRRRNAGMSPVREGETLATHYYVSHPRMVGMLCFFYTRSLRRFPELYSDLQGSDFTRQTEGAGAAFTPYWNPTIFSATSPVVAGSSSSNNNSNSNASGTRLMRTFFSKATRAVKNSLAQHYNRIPVQVFVQSYGSFANEKGYQKDPNKPTTLNKEFKSNASAAVTFSLTQQKDHAVMPPWPGATMVSDLEEDLYGTSPNTFSGDILESDTLRFITTNVNESPTSGVCQRLPLDVVHQYNRYHALLDPTRESSYTTGGGGDTVGKPSSEELERFVDMGQMFAAEPSIWPVIESKRQALLMMPVLPLSQQYCCMPPASDNEAVFCGIPFEAQPLPFSSDLVTREVEIPPMSDEFTCYHKSESITKTILETSTALNYQGFAPNRNRSNLMDDLFASTAPQLQSSLGATNSPRELEDFFR